MTIKIGDYDVQRFCTYTVSKAPVIDSSNNFMTADGSQHVCVLCYKYTINLSAKMIDATAMTSILTAVSDDTFTVVFVDASNTELTKTFRCENVPQDMMYRFSDTVKYWSFDLTFTEV